MITKSPHWSTASSYTIAPSQTVYVSRLLKSLHSTSMTPHSTNTKSIITRPSSPKMMQSSHSKDGDYLETRDIPNSGGKLHVYWNSATLPPSMVISQFKVDASLFFFPPADLKNAWMPWFLLFPWLRRMMLMEGWEAWK